jgi:hypothetical protein
MHTPIQNTIEDPDPSFQDPGPPQTVPVCVRSTSSFIIGRASVSQCSFRSPTNWSILLIYQHFELAFCSTTTAFSYQRSYRNHFCGFNLPGLSDLTDLSWQPGPCVPQTHHLGLGCPNTCVFSHFLEDFALMFCKHLHQTHIYIFICSTCCFAC